MSGRLLTQRLNGVGEMVRGDKYYNGLTEQIIGCAYIVGNKLGAGFLEKVYENALVHELSKSGLDVSRQQPINVHYDDVVVGEYFADLVIEGEIIVELKVVTSFNNAHLAQCLNYLKATKRKLGLLINFGGNGVQIKRVVNNF